MEACLTEIESFSPFRFCFSRDRFAATGNHRAPAQSSAVAPAASPSSVGAAVNFITEGSEKRAPVWMQNLGCEWLFLPPAEPKTHGQTVPGSRSANIPAAGSCTIIATAAGGGAL